MPLEDVGELAHGPRGRVRGWDRNCLTRCGILQGLGRLLASAEATGLSKGQPTARARAKARTAVPSVFSQEIVMELVLRVNGGLAKVEMAGAHNSADHGPQERSDCVEEATLNANQPPFVVEHHSTANDADGS